MRGGLRTCVQNGWKSVDGAYLEHAESWEFINDILCDLESLYGQQTTFCIEQVRVRDNLGARGLVHRTIESYDLIERVQIYVN